jgi:alkylated DNA nucleotide flippase Atl1
VHLNRVRSGLSNSIAGRRGVLARVIAGGRATLGDRVRIAERMLPSLSADWRERVRTIVMQLPRDRVISYSALARSAGVQRAYCRALPSVLRALANRGVSVERVMRGDATNDSWDAADLYAAQEL